MPWFLIACLLTSTVAVGLVFNFDISIKNFDITLTSHKASAQDDTASTVVEVRNAPPTFKSGTNAAESPASTSTSPTNVDGSIGFTAQAEDVENNDYYLIVCPTPGVIASTTGGPPECDDGPTTAFCVSTSTVITEAASCTYNNVADPGAETDDWYAYVCDNHPTQGSCSDSYDQGADPGNGDDSSPLHINHYPYFFTAWTSDDNKDPGGTFTVTASSTDQDILGTPDELVLTVCSSDSWTPTGGCAEDRWCKASSTSPNVTCSFATTTPAKDGSWDYYAFVMDHHYLAATTSFESPYTINNVAPTVSSVMLHGDVDITLSLKYVSEELATTTAIISDNNGCDDIQSATSAIYWSGNGENNYACGQDGDNCYQIGTINCITDSYNTCDGYIDPSVSYVCSTTLAFHTIPTDGAGGNYPYGSTNWLAAIKGSDESLWGVGTTSASNAVTVVSQSGLTVNETEIDFGTIRGGQDSGGNNGTTTIENLGNTPLNSTIDGDDMIRQLGGDWIGASQQRYATSTFTYPGAGVATQLSSTTPNTFDIDAVKPTTAEIDVTDEIYWGIAIPAGKLSGYYDGTNYFLAALDNNDW